MFHRIAQFTRRYLPATISKKHIGIFLVLSTFVGVMLFGLSTQSVSAIDSFNVRDGVLEFFTKICIVLARLAMAFGIFFLRFFIQLAAYNGYLDAPIVRLGWVMLRDIGNMFFVVALLVIAFATILGRESYEWKKAMVKLVLVAILVNFSLLICGLVLDAAHVFTVTFVNAIAPVAAGNLIEMFNFNEMERIITDTGTEGSPDIKLALFGGAVVALGFSVMAATAIGAYCIVLLFRMVSIWALLIFSPLAFILSVLPATENYFEEWKSEFTKNVLAAPIAVFFLWLAFATMSANGGIVSHLDGHSGGNTIGDITQDSTGAGDQVVQVAQDSAAVNSVSLNVASTWANMAGFLVALAFLLKGIEQIQSLGVAGAGWLDSATTFAKTAVTIGSGYAFGRWLVDKGVEGGKGVYERVPFIGGAALKEYSARLKHRYTESGVLGVLSAGALKNYGGVRSKIARSELAKNTEGKAYGLGTLFARIVEPAERVAKRAEDWEKAVENLHHIQEESYSTSGTAAGQAKLNTNQEKEAVEHRAHAKGAEKMAQRTEMLLELAHSYDHKRDHLIDEIASQKNINKAFVKLTTKDEAELYKSALTEYLDKVERKNGGNSANAAERNEARKMRAKTEAAIKQNGLGNLLRLGMDIHKIHADAAKSQAAANEAGEPERRQIEIMEARQRDRILALQGKGVFYEDSVREKHAKEDLDKMSGLSYRQLTKQAAAYVGKNTEIPEIAQAAAATLSVAMKRGWETGMGALNSALGELSTPKIPEGATPKDIERITAEAAEFKSQVESTLADDLVGQQALLLSALTGTRVKKDKVSDVFAKWKESVGVENAQAILKNIDANLKVAGADGAINMTGLFNDRDVDSRGRIEFKLETPDAKEKPGDELTFFERNRLYWAGEVNLAKLKTLADIIDRTEDGVGDAKNAFAQKQLVKVLSTAKTNVPIQSGLISSLKDLKAKQTKEWWDGILNQLPETAKKAIEDAVSGGNKKNA
jgi:hypothetical protein